MSKVANTSSTEGPGATASLLLVLFDQDSQGTEVEPGVAEWVFDGQ